MKNIFFLVASLCMVVLTFMSCIKDSEVATAPECAILTFTVGDIKSSVTVTNDSGNDTVVSKTISGSDIHFNIDQLKGQIYTVDSLPNWIDLTKVVPTFTASGNVYGQVNLANNDSTYYYLTSGSDSIDFTKPVAIAAISTDGLSSKSYTVKINKYVGNTDTLEWTKVKTDLCLDVTSDNLHAIARGNKAFVFYNDAEGKARLAVSVDGTSWTDEGNIDIDPSSVVLFKDSFYALNGDSKLYTSTDGKIWSKAAENSKFVRLCCADDLNLYVWDGEQLVATSDFQTFTPCGNEDMDMLPTGAVTAFCQTSRTNSAMEAVTMYGNAGSTTGTTTAWYKTTSADSTLTEDWSYVDNKANNVFPLPELQNWTVTKYNGVLYGIGRTSNGDYEYLYSSDDNGLSWHPQEEKYLLPADINDFSFRSRVAAIVTVSNEMWIIKGPYIWRGTIR